MTSKYSKDIEKKFLLFINAVLILLTLYILKDLIIVIIFSIISTYLLLPVYNYFYTKFKNKKLASLMTISSALFIIFLPLTILTYVIILNLIKIVLKYSIYLENPELLNTQINIFISKIFKTNLLSNLNYSTIINNYITFIISLTKNFFSSIPIILLNIFILLFITYYLLIHNKEILRSLNEYLPLSLSKQNELIKNIGLNIKILFKGFFLTSLIQTIVAFIGYVITGAPNLLIITSLTFIISLIPYLGTPLIWVPVGIFLIVAGKKIAGISLLIYGALIINSVDNFVRPYLMSSKETTHPLLVLIGFIGGTYVFGITGIIIGPLLITMTQIFLKYLIQQYTTN